MVVEGIGDVWGRAKGRNSGDWNSGYCVGVEQSCIFRRNIYKLIKLIVAPDISIFLHLTSTQQHHHYRLCSMSATTSFPLHLLQQRRDIIAKIRGLYNLYGKYGNGRQEYGDAEMDRVEVPDSVRELLPLLVEDGPKGGKVKFL